MPDVNAPIGCRFSQVYLERGAPQRDSKRARERLAALFYHVISSSSWDAILTEWRREMGVNYSNAEAFYGRTEVRDILDAVTVTWAYLARQKQIYAAGNWRTGCARIFQEENLGYHVDERAGVHFLVDAEFERNRKAVISGLGLPRYAAVLHAFEAAQHAFDGNPPDGKAAMRHTFEALETLFRLICDRAPRLGAAEINGHLKPVVERAYAADATAWRAVQKLLNSFSDWVDGVHFYRHAQGTEEPTAPPLEFAILTVSAGASFLRWLIDVDQAVVQGGKGQ